MRKLSCLLMIALAICLPACSTTGKQQTMVPEIVKPPKVYPEAESMLPCGDLPQPAGPSREQLSKNHRQVAAQYHDCARHHDELIEFEQKRQK